MLNVTQRENIRNIWLYQYSSKEKKGKPVTFSGKPFVVPSFTEIREQVFKKILEQGFSNIEFVKPTNANCIVRVFKLLHYSSDGMIFNIYGAHCFTLKSNKWIGMSNCGEFEIDYSKYTVRHWLFQDEYIDFNFDFFDSYIRIS